MQELHFFFFLIGILAIGDITRQSTTDVLDILHSALVRAPCVGATIWARGVGVVPFSATL